MAAATPLVPTPQAPHEGEQRLVLRGVPWRDYLVLSDLLSDRPGLHLTYLEGTLEIMTTSPAHEKLKKMIARLLELYVLERDISVIGIGSATFRREEKLRGLEPDECYCIGAEKPFPDLAIEVVVTHPDVDKLAVYAGLGVREVWVWKDGGLLIHELTTVGYVERERSALLPELDLQELATHVGMPDQAATVRAYRDALRKHAR